MFIGRQAELRTLHTALLEGGACVLAGPPGIGKTSLAAEYAERNESAHPAGVWRVSLAGSSADAGEMAATLAAGLRAQMGNPRVDDIVDAFAERVAGEPEPSLLVVDDIPGELTAALVDRLSVPPAGRRLRTVLITNWPVPDASVTTLPLGPMTTDEAAGLLGEDGEELAELLGRRPLALRLAALSLRKQSPAELADRLAAAPAPVAELLKDRFDGLGEAACRVLRFSALSSPAALPPGLLRLLLGRPAAEEAVDELHRELLAVPADGAWQVHALVRDAARRHLPPVDWTGLARRMADAVIDHPWSEPVESSLVTRHAARLAGRPDLPGAMVDRLHRRVVALHEPALALPHHRELARRNFDDPAVLVAAAECLRAGGEPAEASECAEQAVPLATDPALRSRARLLLAESLDDLGEAGRADHLWTLLASEDGTDLPFLRSRRLRGDHQEARRGLAELIDRLGIGSAAFHQVRAAQLELARTEIEDGAQAEARRRAVRVIAAHAHPGLSGHADVAEAVRVLLDPRLTPALTDPKEDRPAWEESAGELRRLRDRYAASHGPRHSLALALAVARAEALTALGRPGDARQELEAVHDDLFDRFAREHPARFRAELVLGVAAARSGRNSDAAEHFAGAFHGFGVALGATHANTLRAELALGVALKLTGRRGAARHMLHVLRHAPASAGIGTELFVQSAFGSGLSVFPSWLWRRLTPQNRE
ncbi:ATP-binding protein [Actinoplanes sp. NEAU-A12]|uniref:ATP-binding protein n=1 Tax=Actinoplanes sandaracinus TaxID=3045177 RepID=A0ABT6WTN5_9ACTN|nr:ATP-binding protein [Actinoplanes sandaracinus]MDI6103080.1 ATP-binding protein [Actinoplanes sandaracinus]